MTNAHADRVKEVARLAGRPSRLRRREFLAEGPQAVREAVRSHLAAQASGKAGVVIEVYATSDALQRHPDVAELLGTEGAPSSREVTPEVLAAMASTVTPQGFIAVCRYVDVPLETVLASGPRLVAVLVEVRDPGNAGTIIRAADSAGADAVILTSASVDPYNPKTVRSTVGSLFHVPLVIGVETEVVVDALRRAGLSVLAADGYGTTDLDELQDASAARRLGGVPDAGGSPVRLEDAGGWLFGNEAQGLPSAAVEAADARVAVPIYGQAESLNVGTAATVCLYASARAQRPQRAGPG